MNPAFLTLMIFVFVAFMFWTTYSQQRKAKRAQAELQRLLKKGDEVLTIGGMFGTVRKVGDDFVIVELESGATARVLRRAIREIVSEEVDDIYGDDEDEQTDDEYDEVEGEYEDADDEEYDDVDDDGSEDAGDDAGEDDESAAGDDSDDGGPAAPDAPEAPTPPAKAD
jgi:preprotein translocase subunit YajC